MIAAASTAQRPWVFTFEWCKWVAWFWLPGAALMGMAYAAWHGASMNAWPDFPALAWRGIVACIVVVSAGRLLASWARMSFPAQPWLVAAALLAGFAIGYLALFCLAAFHQSLMQAHQHGEMAAPSAVRDLRQVIVGALGDAPAWVMLFLTCGGCDLPAWLAENRRAREAEMEWLRQQKNEADLRLSVLQAQIEPHFLFNTLASVRALVGTEPARAAATIDALADYLRSTLPQMRAEGDVPMLGPQVEICRRYLELMKVRMGGRLDFVIAVPPEAAAAPFPPLLLLPLVENAVKHGIEPKPEPGCITLRAQVQDGRLCVEVEDDGRGLSAATSSGVGLANVREQLRRRFGDAASLAVTGSARGVRARVEIPLAGA